MKVMVQQAEDDYRIALSALNQWIMMPADFEVVAQQDLKVTLPAVLDTSGLKRTPLLEPFRQDIQVQQARIKVRSEEHTSELQSLMRISYAVFCLKNKNFNKKYSVCNKQPLK